MMMKSKEPIREIIIVLDTIEKQAFLICLHSQDYFIIKNVRDSFFTNFLLYCIVVPQYALYCQIWQQTKKSFLH